MCAPRTLLLSCGGSVPILPRVTPSTGCRALCRALAGGNLPLAGMGGQTLPHPSLVSLLFLYWGSAEQASSSAQASPEAEQTPLWCPNSSASPRGAHCAAHPSPKLCSCLPLSSLKLALLLQSPQVPSSPLRLHPTPAIPSLGWGGRYHPASCSPPQLLPLFWEQRSCPGFTESLGWLFRFMASIF